MDSALEFLVRKRPDEAQRQLLIKSARAILIHRSNFTAIRQYVERFRDPAVVRKTRELAGEMFSHAIGTRALAVQSVALGTPPPPEEDTRALEQQAGRFGLLALELLWAANTLDESRTTNANAEPEKVASSTIVGEEPWRSFIRYILWACKLEEMEIPTASEFAALALVAGLEEPAAPEDRTSVEKRWAARRSAILEDPPGLDFNPWTHRPRGS